MSARDVVVGRARWRVSERFTAADETLHVKIISGPTQNFKALVALSKKLAFDGRPRGCLVEIQISTIPIH